jgi:hypothetical protein
MKEIIYWWFYSESQTNNAIAVCKYLISKLDTQNSIAYESFELYFKYIRSIKQHSKSNSEHDDAKMKCINEHFNKFNAWFMEIVTFYNFDKGEVYATLAEIAYFVLRSPLKCIYYIDIAARHNLSFNLKLKIQYLSYFIYLECCSKAPTYSSNASRLI